MVVLSTENLLDGVRSPIAETSQYNEPIKQDKNLKKISDLDIIRIRTKNGGQRIW